MIANNGKVVKSFMNKKKIFKRVIIHLVIPFVLWVIFTWGVYFLWTGNHLSVIIYGSFPILVIAFVFSVCIHELGHLLMFIIQGYHIKAFIVLGLFIQPKPFKIKFDRLLFTMLGGMVIPKLKDVMNELTWQKHKKTLRCALISGPIFTYIYPIILGLIAILTQHEIMYLLTMSTLFITYFMHKSFFIQKEHMYGDYKAFQKLNKDDQLLLMMYHQHMMLYPFNIETKQFFYQKVYDLWQQKQDVSIYRDRYELMMLSDGFRLGYIDKKHPLNLDFPSVDKISSYRVIKDDMSLAYIVYLYWLIKNDDLASKIYQFMVKKESYYEYSLALLHTFVYDKKMSDKFLSQYQEALFVYQHVIDMDTFLNYFNQQKQILLECHL